MADLDLSQRMHDLEQRCAHLERELTRLTLILNDIVERLGASELNSDIAPSCDAQGHPDDPAV